MQSKDTHTLLTKKQEDFCQAYIRLGDKSAAYREAYSTSKMKPESINRKSFELFNEVKIRSRVEVLQKEVAIRNKITIDELVQTLAGMVRFDIAELYNEKGALKPIHEMSPEARRMISELDTYEEFYGFGEDKQLIGYTKKVKTIRKLDAIEKLMKHLGGYSKDNEQKKPEIHVNWNEQKTYENPKTDNNEE